MMSLPFKPKRFIRGPNLHDERTRKWDNNKSHKENDEEKTKLTLMALRGKVVQRDYEEIISLPPSSSSCSRTTASLVSSSNACQPDDVSNCPSEKESMDGLQRRCVHAKEKTTNCSSPSPKLSKLFQLCEMNEIEELKNILRKHPQVNLNSVDEFGWTLVMCAACAGANECLDFLLSQGADLSLKNKKGQTALVLGRKQHRKEACRILQDFEKIRSKEFVVGFGSESDGHSNSHVGNSTDANVSQKSGSQSDETQFCEPCQTKYGASESQHSKSIAHLVSVSKEEPGGRVHFGIPESNKGFQLMLRSGWDRDGGLGPDGKGHKFPVKTVLKRDREGLGKSKQTARVTHFGPNDPAAVERQVKPEERLQRKRTLAKREELGNRLRERRKEIDYRRELGSL